MSLQLRSAVVSNVTSPPTELSDGRRALLGQLMVIRNTASTQVKGAYLVNEPTNLKAPPTELNADKPPRSWSSLFATIFMSP